MIRALQARVTRLERASLSQSSFEATYGSLDAFITAMHAGIDAGQFDSTDMPLVLAAIERWHRDGEFGAWRRNGVWESVG